MDDQRSLEEQLLGDMSYDDPRKHTAPAAPGAIDPRLAGASAVTLDDMSSGTPEPPKKPQYQELTDAQIQILQNQRAEKGLPPYTAEEIAALKNEFIERQIEAARQQHLAETAAAQQQAAAALLSEPEDYSQPEKREPTKILPEVDASALLEEPAPEPERRAVFNQEDLEAAKKQAAKRASEALTEAPAKTEEDQQRARKELQELRRQQMADLAQKGFSVSIITTALGILAGLGEILFSIGAYNSDDPSGVFKLFDKVYLLLGVLLVGLSITVVVRLKRLKGTVTLVSTLSAISLVVPGIVELLSAKRGASGFAVTCGGYLLGIVLSIVVTVMVSSSAPLSAYYSQNDIMYD